MPVSVDELGIGFQTPIVLPVTKATTGTPPVTTNGDTNGFHLEEEASHASWQEENSLL